MNYRLISARFLVATYGNIDPSKLGSLHMLALTHGSAKDIVPVLDDALKSWKSPAVADAIKGLSAARAYLSTELSKKLKVTACEVTGSELDGSYKPIYDEKGTVIGHETVGWILVDGNTLDQKAKTSKGDNYGMVACVFLAVVRT